jgi:ABC-type branched-subunit amino acid transport system substrate-binding protein
MIQLGLTLGVDFGTSSTVAVLRQPDGRQSPLLFDGTPIMPSAVWAAPDAMLVGASALYSAAGRPDALEPTPKQRIDEDTVLLGAREAPVVELIAAVLAHVRDEAERVGGSPVTAVVLTHPATWGPRRRDVLGQAAKRAGFDQLQFIAEPVAAAVHLARLSSVRTGDYVLVYDFGAGTFDVSVVRRTETGFDVVASAGLPDAGGLDIDAAVMAYLGANSSARDPHAWQRLTRPADTASRRASRQLWDDVRRAKELLSRAASTSVYLPLLDIEVPLGREQLEQLAEPVVARTVAATVGLLRDTGLTAGQLAAVFLVGGASRLPLAASLLHRALGIAPTTVEHPELVVAEGSLHAAGPAPVAAPPPPASPALAPPTRERRRRPLVWALALLLVVAGVVAGAAAAIRPGNLFGAADANPACGKRIGVLTQFGGSWVAMGNELRAGAQRAIDEYNQRHTACPVTMPVYDAAASIDDALADNALIGVVGPLLSADVNQLGPNLNRAGLPVITPSATDASLSSHGWPIFHRIIAGDADQGRAASNYLTMLLHARRVYVLDDNSGYGRGTADAAMTALGGSSAGKSSLPSEPGQYANLVKQIATAKPDAIYFGGFATGLPDLLRALHAAQIRVPVLGPDALHDLTLAQHAGADADGVSVTCLCTKTPPPAFGSDPVRAYAYDAANILLAGIASGVATRARMVEYLKHSRTTGVMGDYQFRDNGELKKMKVAILSIKNGAFTDTTSIPVS